MRKFLILALSVFALVACEKDKTDTPTTTADSSVDQTSQDAVAAPDSVTPTEDVTTSVDATPVSAPDAVTAG